MAAAAERALKWSALTTVARFALQLAAQVALARLLGPGNFGVYGIGIAVLTFAAFLSGASFSWNPMLLPSVSQGEIRFSFTWQVIAGTLTACAMAAAAPVIADFFADPRVQGMVRWLAVASLLTAASGPAICLLQRDLDFRALGLIQLASYAAGYLVVGVTLALLGYGAWSLAAACVVQAAVTLVLAYRARPHSLRPLFAHPGGRAALVTGRAVFLTNVVNWLLGNLDRIVIGRVLNAHAVGLYHVAYNLASIPNVLLIGSLQPTFLAAGAKLQHEPQRLAQGWLLALACILVLGTPAAVVLALLASDLVQLLYGPAWMEGAWVLGLLFLCLPAWACWGLSTPVLWNTNRKHREFLLQLPLLAAAVPLWWLFAPSGIRAVAAVSACVIYARAVVIIGAGLAALDLRWAALVPDITRGVALAAICAAAAAGAQQAVASLALPLASLVAAGACALGALAAVVAARPQVLGPAAHAALARLFPAFALRRPLPRAAVLPAEPGGPAR